MGKLTIEYKDFYGTLTFYKDRIVLTGKVEGEVSLYQPEKLFCNLISNYATPKKIYGSSPFTSQCQNSDTARFYLQGISSNLENPEMHVTILTAVKLLLYPIYRNFNEDKYEAIFSSLVKDCYQCIDSPGSLVRNI